MRKKLLSLTLALALCLGLTVPAFAKDLKDAAKQDILNLFTVYRNGSIDETEGTYLVDAPFKLLEIEYYPIEKEGYSVISKDDSWTITNTGSKELSASDNPDYELLIYLYIYYPEAGADDEYVFHGSYTWSRENECFTTDPVVRLKAGESVTIPASALMAAGGSEAGSSPIYELYIDAYYQGVFDDWQYYKIYYSEDILRVMRSCSFYFLVDEAQKSQIDAAGTVPPAESEDPVEPETPVEPEPPTEPEPPEVTFPDVPDGAWYAEAVNWAAKEGYVGGYPDGTFRPAIDMTEAQILTLLHNAAGSPASEAPLPSAAEDGQWYSDALRWAMELDMIDDGFELNTPCTRATSVYYLWQAYGSQSVESGASFSDIPEDADYAGAVAWAVEEGIVEGYSDGTYRPDGIFNRGSIATLLYRTVVPEARLK